jgi:hypothetical protein
LKSKDIDGSKIKEDNESINDEECSDNDDEEDDGSDQGEKSVCSSDAGYETDDQSVDE